MTPSNSAVLNDEPTQRMLQFSSPGSPCERSLVWIKLDCIRFENGWGERVRLCSTFFFFKNWTIFIILQIKYMYKPK